MKCHTQCLDGCHQPNDPTACVNRCRNVKQFTPPGQTFEFLCLDECGPGYEAIKNDKDGQLICTPCKAGSHKAAKGKNG